ncbi:MAG: carboxylating nicotinate-nucleotide diphosphorylase [Saprospiraceae bacterium]|nr:carboxylating nicotinate-nucleotide diphosphorylase [Saprospiraceae bacterium]
MEGIDDKVLDKFIDEALYEDVRDGDHTSLACIPSDLKKKAKLLVKDEGVIAGVEFAERVFRKLDPDTVFTKYIEDGTDVKYGDIAFEVTANAQALLKGERLVLNTMQRMSGISTMSSRFAVEVEGLPVKVLDTRKTTPLLRFIEKWAVRIGGCTNYRDGLYDWIMIKDNHVDACGSISKAIDKVHEYLKENQLDLGITVEVRNLVELYEVLDKGGITRIMLDNFELPLLREAVATIKGRFESEASGGVTLQTVRKIAETGVDFVSVGALTHSAGCLDLSLKIQK